MNNLSWHALLFLLERTDFSEPWNGFGFATQMKEEILKVAQRKANGDSVKEKLLNQLLNQKKVM